MNIYDYAIIIAVIILMYLLAKPYLSYSHENMEVVNEKQLDVAALITYINSKITPTEQYIQRTNIVIDNEIPYNIYMIWHSSELPPIMKTYVDNTIATNREFNFFIYNVDDCRNFIGEKFDTDVLNAFDSLVPMAYKADLWRYCILYINGGIYLDIKFAPVNGFKFIHLMDKERFPLERVSDYWDNGTFGMYNGFLIAKPGNQILLDCINDIVTNVKEHNYCYNDLYPTGPGLLGLNYFKHNKSFDDIDVFFTDVADTRGCPYRIQYNNSVILESYPEYLQERKSNDGNRYGKVYIEKNIYGELNDQK